MEKTISRFAHSSKGKYLKSPIFVPEFYEIFLSGMAVKIGKQLSFSGNEKSGGGWRCSFSPPPKWFLRNGVGRTRAHQKREAEGRKRPFVTFATVLLTERRI